MLTISPFEPVYQEVYQRVLDNIPAGNFILRAPVIVPLREGRPSEFTVETDVGTRVMVYHDNTLVHEFVAVTTVTTVPIFLQQGRNTVSARSQFESSAVLLAAVNYATYLSGWAEQWYFNVESRVEDHRAQIMSPFGLRTIENQLTFHDLLPATRVMRTLAGKLAVKSLLNLGGSTEGVTDLVTAVSGTTPVVVPTLMDSQIFEPAMRPVLLRAHDMAGFEFHLWLLNLCATEWNTFVQLCNNLPDRLARLISVTDRRVVVERNAVGGPGTGTLEAHAFDFDGAGCSIVDVLTRFFDCFSRIRVFVRTNLLSRFAFCGYVYPHDTVVSVPIGVRLFDTGIPFDSELLLDSAEESDPYAAARGWLGLPLIHRLDHSHPFDSMSGFTAFPEDLDCAFDRPGAVGAVSSRVDTELSIPLSMTTSLTITF